MKNGLEAVNEDQTFYRDLKEHLFDELKLLDLRFELLLEKKKSMREERSSGFFISAVEVEMILKNRKPSRESPEERMLEQQVRMLEQKISSRAALGIRYGSRLPLYSLLMILGLSPFEYCCVAACLASEVELKYHKIYGFINNDITNKFPSIQLVMQLLGISPEDMGEVYEMLERDKPLTKYLLADMEREAGISPSFVSKPLKLEERVVGYLLGSEAIDKRLCPVASLLAPNEFPTPRGINNEIQKSLRAFINEHPPNKRNTIFYLYGKDDYCPWIEVREFCRRMGKKVLLADLGRMVDDIPLSEYITLLEREVLLTQAVLCIKEFDTVMDPGFPENKAVEILRLLDFIPGPVFLIGKTEWRYIHSNCHYHFADISVPGAGEKDVRLLWQITSVKYRLLEMIDWDLVASKFPFNEEQIQRVFEDAWSKAIFNRKEGISAEDLCHACNFHMRHQMGEKTLKIRPKYGLGDIILPNEQKRLLKNLCSQMKYRNVVYRDWGFARKLSYGKGIHAVFSGPPGTGKTMAAQVVAKELGMELYRIDLSQVVSKYIGETEKNLHTLFEEGKKLSAILFFDEADAIFGKRSEVKDARDRYANMEISYLLQKMEEYEGISIMATNLIGNMDEAFKRRIQFIIEFPFPNAGMRKKIWESLFPKEAPLGIDVDFDFLAEAFEVSGGNIKNIAVSAAFHAAEMSSAIGMEHIITAAKYELKKMGKICSGEKLAMYLEDGQR
ncbi:MAG: AAA family ATPase [Clostridia bacterium]|nr:AAA family ATPase [Clostridia bacterium]